MKVGRDTGDSAEAWAEFRRVGLWVAIGIGAVAGYVFVYPVIVIYVMERLTMLNFSAEAVDVVVEISIEPLNWLHDRSGRYREYIEWVDDRVAP